ncbi:hypothetical protein [Lysobacter sp. Root916]|uniref:hypothetical protein n=1 Tax=Lysobacter sp. Root916 TaxID=1736606 RepID=UPI0012FB04D6|nr:hypothetical protein [Lysobacter sp. Root916]
MTWAQLAGDATSSVSAARQRILAWVAERTSEILPSVAYDGRSFSLALGNGAAVSGQGIWALRFDTADEKLKEDGIERRWRTEVVLARIAREPMAHLSLRLSVVTTTPGVPFGRTAPKLLRTLASEQGLVFDGVTDLENYGADLELLVQLLEQPERRPVILVAEDDAGRVTVNVDRLKNGAIGFAHVVRVPSVTARAFIREVGGRWAVFPGGIRIYYPGVDFSESQFRAHPFWSLASMPRESSDIRRFEQRLIYRLLAMSVNRTDIDDLAPSFGAVDAMLREAQLLAAARASEEAQAKAEAASTMQEKWAAQQEQLDTLHVEVSSLKGELQAVKERSREVVQDRDMAYDANEEYTAEIERLQGQLYGLGAKVRALEGKLLERGDATVQAVPIPSSFNELAGWAETYYPDRLVVLPKAARAAKKSVYDDVAHIYQCLMLLADEYVDYRRGEPGAQMKYQDACSHLRVEVTPVGAALDNRKYRDQFRTPYKSGYSEIDLHLSPAPGTSERGSYDPKRTYRIYFFWDEENEFVVVGSLPAHLTTSLTN